MLKIQELKRNQVFFGKDVKGNAYEFKVWMEPYLAGGFWSVDCTDSGDYCFTFTEDDEGILYLTNKLEE